MIIDRSGIKKMALYAGLILCLVVGSYYLFHNGKQLGNSQVKSGNLAVKTPAAMDVADNEFCASYRIEREKVRSREVSILNGVANEGSSDSQARGKAMQRLVEISSDIENELKAENLVRCHGARDCVAMVEPDNATLIIVSSPMHEEQVTDLTADLCKIMDREEGEINLIFRQD